MIKKRNQLVPFFDKYDSMIYNVYIQSVPYENINE